MSAENSEGHENDEESGQSALTDNLELLKAQLPESSLARVLVEARQAAPQDTSALEKIVDKRLEQLREPDANAADQDN